MIAGQNPNNHTCPSGMTVNKGGATVPSMDDWNEGKTSRIV
jgi:hypothetical protein